MQQAATDPSPTPPVEAGSVALYAHLVRLRVVSARMVSLQREPGEGEASVAFHTASIGEEATVAAAALALADRDWLFPGAREWGAALVRGVPLSDYVHHAFGSARDPAKGHAPPDHVPSRSRRVVPPSGVLGAHLVQAVGCAWAARARGDDAVALALFGEAATSTGDFHNALNFAGVFKAPVVFVCRRDQRGVARAPESPTFAGKAAAYGVATARVDGADALAVLAVTRAAIERARGGEGPTLIEAFTEPLEPSAPLAETERLLALGDSDPIVRLGRALERDGASPGAEAVAREANAELDAAVAAAREAGPPPRASIFEDVYAEPPAHLVAQRKEIAS